MYFAAHSFNTGMYIKRTNLLTHKITYIVLQFPLSVGSSTSHFEMNTQWGKKVITLVSGLSVAVCLSPFKFCISGAGCQLYIAYFLVNWGLLASP